MPCVLSHLCSCALEELGINFKTRRCNINTTACIRKYVITSNNDVTVDVQCSRVTEERITRGTVFDIARDEVCNF